MFWYEDFGIITLIILLVVYILGKSKHLIGRRSAFSLHSSVKLPTKTTERAGGSSLTALQSVQLQWSGEESVLL